MSGHIRQALPKDVPQMVALSGAKRREYAAYQPVFWREAARSDSLQTPFFQAQVARQENISLVWEDGDAVQGFVIATLNAAPPVYDPGGLTCVVDDFAVENAADWSTIGRALLAAVSVEAKARGAAQLVVVCGHRDRSKRELLSDTGCTIASEWYVQSL